MSNYLSKALYCQIQVLTIFIGIDCESTYSAWSEWGGDTTVTVSSSQCGSEEAVQQTRNRYNLQDGCDPVESETQHICK